MNLKNLVLRPNCLLTKSPLVFLSGPRSLFFFSKPYGDLPAFLFEHGYRIAIPSLPFTSRQGRSNAFTNWVQTQKDKTFHIITDEFTFEEFEKQLHEPYVRSLTVLTTKTGDVGVANTQQSLFQMHRENLHTTGETFHYKLHKLWVGAKNRRATPFDLTFHSANDFAYQRFLDHCVKLAESEMYA